MSLKTAIFKRSRYFPYSKVTEWVKLISITGSAQALIQLLGLLTGILIIRLLSTEEYGLYTLANATLGTLTVISDGGVSSSVMAQAANVWPNRQKVSIVISTGFRLRKQLSVIGCLFSIPLLVYLLLHHNASLSATSLITLSIIPSFFAALSGSLLQVEPILSQNVRFLQKNLVMVASLRFVSLIATLFFLPFAFIAILVNGIPQIWGNIRMKKKSEETTEFYGPEDAKVKKDIIAFVRRIFPSVLYYCLSGQITIWLLSIFGTTASVAKIGALGRLALILGIFNTLFSTLIAPRFAKLPKARGVLMKKYLSIQLGLVCLSLLIIGFIWLFAPQLLYILGGQYADLKRELIMSMIGGCLAMMAGSSFGLSNTRSWAINPLISIPISIASIVSGTLMIDISSISGALTLSIWVNGIEAFMHFAYMLFKIQRT